MKFKIGDIVYHKEYGSGVIQGILNPVGENHYLFKLLSKQEAMPMAVKESDLTPQVECPECSGTGKVSQTWEDKLKITQPCSLCKGEGELLKINCYHCHEEILIPLEDANPYQCPKCKAWVEKRKTWNSTTGDIEETTVVCPKYIDSEGWKLPIFTSTTAYDKKYDPDGGFSITPSSTSDKDKWDKILDIAIPIIVQNQSFNNRLSGDKLSKYDIQAEFEIAEKIYNVWKELKDND